MPLAKHLLLLLVAVSLVGLTVASMEAQTETKKPVPKAAPPKALIKPGTKAIVAPKADESVEAIVKKSAEAFAAAYNAGNAKAIAAGYTPDGEYIDEDGHILMGREAIEQHFTSVFKELPKARVKIVVEAVRPIAANIALEEGVVEATANPQAATEISKYIALHVKHGDQWLLARTRDYPTESAPPTNHERLLPLEWLVGEWVDESPDALIVTSCKWADNENYLLQEFTARIGGRVAVNGSTRIGWDPLSRQIKSWTFDSAGGYSEALWTQLGDEWILKSRGVSNDGEVSSATNIIGKVDASTMTWSSRDRVVGGEISDDIDPIVVKRRAPAPAE
jgi:uncharacterized protein (TIGR02246 family)